MKWNNTWYNKLSTVSLILFCFIIFASTASAQHDATLTITPDIANCDQLGNTFTVNVKNNGSSLDEILQVEIYEATKGTSIFTCGQAPTGWS
ncbi:MAG: hypothetical protein ABIE23_05895, partial [archaeon]